MGGIIGEAKRLSTKNGSTMAFIKLEDIYGSIEVIAFPKIFEKCRNVLNVEEIISVSGKIQIKDGIPQIIADDVKKLEIKEQEKEEVVGKEMLGLIIPDDATFTTDDIYDVLESYPGDIPVILAIKGKKYDAKISIRKCDGLKNELVSMVGKNGLVFFIKNPKKSI